MTREDVVAAGLAEAPLLAALHREGCGDPWSSDLFATHLSLAGTFARIVTVAVADGEPVPVGLVLARLAVDELEILTIAVARPWRRRGLGRRLLGAAMAAGGRHGARRLVLEVAADNAAARALYAAAGLVAVGRRSHYYHRGGTAVDALILAADLEIGPDHSPRRARLNPG